MTSRNRLILRGVTASGAAAALAALLAAPAAATTYNLATFTDDATVNGNCTLREALLAANTNAPVDACAAGGLDDAIVLPTGTYDFNGQLALGGTGSLSITSADLNPFHVTIDLHGAGRFVSLSGSGSYVFGGLSIVNGAPASSYSDGGAIYAEDVALRVFNFRFVSNSSDLYAGGALFYLAETVGTDRGLIITNGTFFDNHLTNTATGATSTLGGGAYVRVANGNYAFLRDVNFIGNSSSDMGSDAVGGGLALFAYDGSVATCVRCNFQDNSVAETVFSAEGGGAFVAAGSNATLSMVDCRFIGNAASAPGERATAALGVEGTTNGSVYLDRLFIDYNGGINDVDHQDVFLQADSGATVSLVDSELTFGAASGLYGYTNGGILRVGHLTIADYPGPGAIFRVFGGGAAVLENSILVFNGVGPGVPSTPASNFQVIEGSVAQTTNFIGGDALIVDEPSGNYRLAPGSPAIDAGTSSVVTFRSADLDHRSRRAGGATDIGCYEYNSLFAYDFDATDLSAWSGHTP